MPRCVVITMFHIDTWDEQKRVLLTWVSFFRLERAFYSPFENLPTAGLEWILTETNARIDIVDVGQRTSTQSSYFSLQKFVFTNVSRWKQRRTEPLIEERGWVDAWIGLSNTLVLGIVRVLYSLKEPNRLSASRHRTGCSKHFLL